MCSPRTVIFGGEKLHFLQFLSNTSTIISYRTSLMATGWIRSLPIEKSLSFVTISNFKFDISFFWRKFVLQVYQFSLVFFTTSQLHILTKSNVCRRLLHCGCLLCVHKLMKFTYDVIFYVAFVTLICVSLFTGIHCVICVVKKL